MKRVDYNQLKKEVEQKYKADLERAGRDRLETLAAIDKVWELINGEEDTKASSSPSDYGKLTDLIQNAFKYLPPTFSKQKVIRKVKELADGSYIPNPNSVGSCLHRLVKRDILIEVSKGTGSIPTEYKLKKSERM